jgi:hypothetical protein
MLPNVIATFSACVICPATKRSVRDDTCSHLIRIYLKDGRIQDGTGNLRIPVKVAFQRHDPQKNFSLL